MSTEMPTITASTYTTTTNAPVAANGLAIGNAVYFGGQPEGLDKRWVKPFEATQQDIERRLMKMAEIQPQKEQQMATRIVKVFIVDPDTNVPLEKRVLHKSEEFITESTDQELFFEIDIKTIMTQHNDYRKTVVNKAASERLGKEVFLEPTRVGSLRMSVVQVAGF